MTLKQKYHAALALAGETNQQFAARIGVHPSLLSNVLYGKTQSRRAEKEMEKYANRVLNKLRKAA